MLSNYLCSHTTDWQMGLTCMISDWIGIYPVLLPLVIAQIIIEILSFGWSRILSHFSIITNAIIAVVLYFSTTVIMLLWRLLLCSNCICRSLVGCLADEKEGKKELNDKEMTPMRPSMYVNLDYWNLVGIMV